MQIKVDNATLGDAGKSNAVVTVDLDEMKQAVAMFLASKGINVDPKHVEFTHMSDYDTREISGASVPLVVKIAQV